MAPRIRPLRPEELDLAQREVYDAITSGPRARAVVPPTAADGSLRGPFDAMLRSPAVGSALQALGAALRYRSALTDREREIAILLVAAHWASAFERDYHEEISRALGFTEDELAGLRRADASVFADREAEVALAVLGMCDGDLDDAQWSAAIEALGEGVVFELSTFVGYYATLALQLRVFRVDG